MMKRTTPGAGLGVRIGAAAAMLCVAGTAVGDMPFNAVFLQYFEQEWDDVERRMPDVFVAGYHAFWLPPPSLASFTSAGYDPFDRFSLGEPPVLSFTASRKRTTYGTEATFDAMIAEAHRANVQVTVDAIFNHQGGRTESDAFIANGGWPGFYLPRENPPQDKQPTDDWGDFNEGFPGGYFQSENPSGPNYDLENGDLVSLCDIEHQDNHQFIRHPVGPDANNLPAGLIYNIPDPDNAALYPDTSLSPQVFTNPGTPNNPGSQVFTRYPFNQINPLAGDAVVENATGMLMRWGQWLIEEKKVDGLRLDAQKHTPTFFWDTFFDSAVFKARTDVYGNKVTPFSYGENVTGNFNILNNYVRKDGFGNRDSLDLQGAARLREIVNAQGFGAWSNIQSNTDSGHLDIADDGFVNGTMGVNHVFSHDNGSVGDGGSMPPYPTIRQQGLSAMAYTLMRPGRAIVYHNARGITNRTSGFFVREGSPNALGLDPTGNNVDDAILKLMESHNQVAFAQYFPLSTGSDLMVFERAFNGQANCLVAVNDRWDPGLLSITVNTQYPQGTRLHEQTGNAADPAVDPGNQIPEIITVGAGGQVQLFVPKNASTTGDHGRGYVVYAEPLPTATLSFPGQSGTIPPDPASFPDALQRLTELPIITANSFEIRLDTAQTDPVDPNTDDNALFRINAGTQDWNGNGGIDITPGTSVIGGYEEFITQNSPTFGSGGPTGVYRQTIDATQLDEGFNYVSAIAFRHRPAGTSPIFREQRAAIYVDRMPPDITFVESGQAFPSNTVDITVLANDRTTFLAYAMVNLPDGVDPLTQLTITNQMTKFDRFEWRDTFILPDGEHDLTIVSIEESGNATIIEETITVGDPVCPCDTDGSGDTGPDDIDQFVTDFIAGNADIDGDGDTDADDIAAFVTCFVAGCP